MQLKNLTAIVSVALALGVHAAPRSFDVAAGVQNLLKRSYSHGIDMSQVSKRALNLVKKQSKHHRRSTKRCIAPRPNPTSTPVQVQGPQTTPSSYPTSPLPSPSLSPSSTPSPPAPSPSPTQANNGSTGNNGSNNGNNTDNNNTSDTGSGAAAPNDLAQQFLDAHNTARAQHGAAALTWSDELANAGESWANGCKFKHSGGSLGPYGENLAVQTGSLDAAQAVKLWTDEVGDYDPSNPQPSHFTQVVWKGSTQLGCAIVRCAPGTIFDSSYGDSYYAVCEYSPAGNVIGQFAENVQK